MTIDSLLKSPKTLFLFSEISHVSRIIAKSCTDLVQKIILLKFPAFLSRSRLLKTEINAEIVGCLLSWHNQPEVLKKNAVFPLSLHRVAFCDFLFLWHWSESVFHWVENVKNASLHAGSCFSVKAAHLLTQLFWWVTRRTIKLTC